LFNTAEIDREMLSRADDLLDELRPESPLRHRLWLELEELRSRLKAAEKAAKPKRTRKLVAQG
jgi:hypothetical protein